MMMMMIGVTKRMMLSNDDANDKADNRPYNN